MSGQLGSTSYDGLLPQPGPYAWQIGQDKDQEQLLQVLMEGKN